MAHTHVDDDGFDDFLSEDEEKCTLQTQEMAALARKMKTVGVREAMDIGKESTLQEGFDAGFYVAAQDGFLFSARRGALAVAVASGLTSALDTNEHHELTVCIEELRVRSLRVPQVSVTVPETIVNGELTDSTAAAASTDDAAKDTALRERADAWIKRLQLPIEIITQRD